MVFLFSLSKAIHFFLGLGLSQKLESLVKIHSIPKMNKQFEREEVALEGKGSNMSVQSFSLGFSLSEDNLEGKLVGTTSVVSLEVLDEPISGGQEGEEIEFRKKV